MNTEDVYIDGKLIITAADAARGYKLIGKNKDFALVQPVNENVVLAVPLRRELKPLDINFEAIDFLTFREGRKPVESPWKYVMCINGLHRVTVTFRPKYISFQKMSEWNWKEILPELKSTLSREKNRLLAGGKTEAKTNREEL